MSNAPITITGNLTRDPELRFTNGGRAVATLGVAVSHRYQVNGEWQEETSYVNAVAWGELGENAAASLTKGARVTVTGRLSIRSYEDKDGNARSATEIVADDVAASVRYATMTIERKARTGAADKALASVGAGVSNDEEPF